MSILARRIAAAAPTTVPARRRDIGTFPWTNGETVPTPLEYSGFYSGLDAFKIAAVTACVGLRAGALAQLPLRGFLDTADGINRLAPLQPELLRNPSPSVPPSVWKIQMQISRDLFGYAAGEILGVDAAGYPSKVEWIAPDRILAWQNYAGGPLRWRVGGRELDPSLVLHVPSRWVLPGNPLGVSPLEHSGLVELARAAQKFGLDWFIHGAVPSAVVYSTEELDEVQAEQIANNITRKWRARRPAVLDARLKYEKMSVAANESQFLETKRAAAGEIAVAFNLPPDKINAAAAGSDQSYANREQSEQQYLIDSVNPDLVVVQEVINMRCMPPSISAQWITGAFLRSDLKTRYEAALLGVRGQFIHPDEIRAQEGLPPLTDEQRLTMPHISGGATVPPGGADQ